MSTQMRYMIKTDGTDYEVCKLPVPKKDPKGVQKIDKATGLGIFMIGLAAWSEKFGAQVMEVGIAAHEAPELTFREPVEVVDLEIIPWAQKDRDTGDVRSGVAFRAKEIRPLAA